MYGFSFTAKRPFNGGIGGGLDIFAAVRRTVRNFMGMKADGGYSLVGMT